MLLVAVMLPTAALVVVAGVLLSERYRSAADASAIAHRVPALTGMVSLHALLGQERMRAETTLREREMGISAAGIPDALGISGGSEATARAAVDAQLRVAGPSVPANFVAALRAVRREVDGGRTDGRTIDRGYTVLSDELAVAVDGQLSTLGRLTANTAGAETLEESITTLTQVNEALGAGSNEAGALSDVYFDREPHRRIDLGVLGAQMALFERAGAQLLADGVQPVRGAFAAIVHSEAWPRFHAASAAALAGAAPFVSKKDRPAAGSGQLLGDSRLLAVALPLLAGSEAMHRVYGAADLAVASVRSSAAHLQSSGSAAFRDLLLETLVGVGLTIAFALLLARSISTPLRRLEAHARAVSAGDLDVEPLRPAGPKETVVASRAFNDLVANLRLLEVKARRLAECAFEDPVLSEQLPGALGRALERSVTVLSGSIVEREQLQQRLVQQATHDSLTGLHNRAAAVEFLDGALARAARTGRPLAVLFVDLDDFKHANDTHGHGVGDAILTAVSRRMAGVARSADFLARLGGDEFVVIAEDVADAAEARAIALRLVEALQEPVQADGMSIAVAASIGVALALDGGVDDGSQLLARADLALYRAKRAPHSNVELFDAELGRELAARASVEKDLTAALEEPPGGLFLEYQPVIDAASGELASVEALVRWERPGHGRCLPGGFIGAAEAGSLILDLDRWVLAAALAQQRAWRSAGLGTIPVAANISGRHLLSGRLVEHVVQALEATGSAPDALTLELTETVLLTDLPDVALELERLRGLGVRIAIDDFGTGYTSLAHLQHLTVDAVKIDRSFTRQLPAGRDRRLVEMITEVGHHLGLAVVAEGVETGKQLTALREIGCDLLQGFLIAVPLAVQELEDGWLRPGVRGSGSGTEAAGSLEPGGRAGPGRAAA